MKTYKCGRCEIDYQPNKRFPKTKLKYGRDKMRLCPDCHCSYMWWSVSAEIEKENKRKAERELFVSIFGDDNKDFAMPTEVTDIKYSYLGVEHER